MEIIKAISIVAILHIMLADAAINLKMFRDPRSVQLKSNLIQRRHTSGECLYK